METIEKQISLEDYKTRFICKIPAYNDNVYHDGSTSSWGMMPMDSVINSGMAIYNIVTQLPCLYENNKYVLRYWDIRDLFLLIRNVACSCSFYRLCLRKSELKWVSVNGDFYDRTVFPSLEIRSVLPSTGDTAYTKGDIVCVSSSDVQAVNRFNSCFRKTGTTTRYELDFINFFNTLHKGEHSGYTVPFVDVDLHIFSDFEDIGVYTAESEYWIPKKKYYLGDLVIYNDILYKLIKGWDGKTSGDTYYRGYYNTDTMLVEFDEPNVTHWLSVSSVTTVESATTAYTESALKQLLPYRRTYDDYGTLLPFIVENNTVYLLYNYEPKHIEVIAGGNVVADTLLGVKGYDASDNVVFSSRYDTWGKRIPVSAITGTTRYLDFDYVIQGEMTCNSANTITYLDNASGIRYRERYSVSFKSVAVTIEGVVRNYIYLNIGEMLLNEVGDDMKSWSKTVFNPITIKASDDFHVFKQDSLQGVHGVNEKSDELYVTRGRSAAFERHCILMEVRSFDDLNNYRNNYFNL